jgi:aminobenzoyl-glutamate utilization protein B
MHLKKETIMALKAEKKKLINKVISLQKDFWRISDAIWNFAELSLEEYRSSELLAETLEQAGFNVTYGVAQLPTAFVATWKNGTGLPVIGFTAEYDALPALSQKCGLPQEEAIIPGAPGHGCGHNTMAAMQLLAIVALQETIVQNNLNVTLKFFGCPAEELAVSRPYMIRAGLFKGVDVVIDSHADALFKTTYGMLGTALHSTMITYYGKSSHAGWKPWLGRSAGDAVELLHAGTERMREHVPPINRIHWVTKYAGDAPNIVPDRAETWYYIRDLDENIEAVTEWVNDCAKGAAMMTQTRCEVRVLAAVHQRFYNQALAELLYKNMKVVGKPRYSKEEKAFALNLQEKARFPKKGMSYPVSLINAEEDELRASSSDMGDVCLTVPTGQISIPVWVPGTPAHDWTATVTGATSIAHKGISAAAKAVALTVFDLLTDKNQLKKIKTEFKTLSNQRPYKPFLPEKTKPPHGFYKDIMDRYRDKLENSRNTTSTG